MSRQQGIRYVLAGAMIAAPFLALIYSLTAALVVMLGALLATVWIGQEAMKSASPDAQQRLRIVIVINLLVALAIGAALLWLLLA